MFVVTGINVGGARDVPRDTWRERFVSDGMTNPTPRIQMLDGFSEGWITFEEGGTERRTGVTTLRQVLAHAVARTKKN